MSREIKYQYIVITRWSENFNEAVIEKLNEGWKCQGGVFIEPEYYHFGFGDKQYYSQAMIKEVEN